MQEMRTLLLGDEAVAAAAVDAGIGAAYGYPGTPSTEILRREMEYPGLSVVIARRACVMFKPMKEKRAG